MFILEKIQANKMAKNVEKQKREISEDKMFERLYGEYYNKNTTRMTIFGFILGLFYDILALNGVLPINLFVPGYYIMIACFGWIIGQRYKQIKKDIFYHR